MNPLSLLGWLKGLPVWVWGILIALAVLVGAFFAGAKWQHDKDVAEYLNLPVQRDTTWQRDTVRLTDTHYVTTPIYNTTTIHDTVTVTNPGCDPWTISEKLYQGDKGAVFVGQLEGTIFPKSRRFVFDIKDPWISFPSKTVTETRNIPVSQHFADICGSITTFGLWDNGFFAHNIVTVQPEIEFHFGQLSLSVTPIGIACMNNTAYTIHSMGGRFNFTKR